MNLERHNSDWRAFDLRHVRIELWEVDPPLSWKTDDPIVPSVFRECPEPSPELTSTAKLIYKLMERWDLDSETICAALGFEKTKKTRIENGSLVNLLSARSRDLKDRISNLTEIYVGLFALFKDPKAEKAWLQESQEILDGDSAGQRLAEGSMENLMIVRQLIEYLCGR